jgi:hypothetical protein
VRARRLLRERVVGQVGDGGADLQREEALLRLGEAGVEDRVLGFEVVVESVLR